MCSELVLQVLSLVLWEVVDPLGDGVYHGRKSDSPQGISLLLSGLEMNDFVLLPVPLPSGTRGLKTMCLHVPHWSL